MAKLRFLQSAFIPALNKMLQYDEVLEVEDEKVIESLIKANVVDKLIEEEAPKAKKTKLKVTELVD